MMNRNWLTILDGWLGTDPYSTAWCALVPDLDNLSRPAWPEALEYLRSCQLDDGAWGDPDVYYAHERTIATLAAIRALHTWREESADALRIQRGLAAVRSAARKLSAEANEPIGFELLLISLRAALAPDFGHLLPLKEWGHIDDIYQEKLALTKQLTANSNEPHSWWFSMEILSEDQLAQLDDSVLDANGSIAASPSATAAYLRAQRTRGGNSPRAEAYLSQLVNRGGGSVPFCWPADTFVQVWGLDYLDRAMLDLRHPSLLPVVQHIYQAWYSNTPGLSYTDAFKVNDGDDTLLGYNLLLQAHMAPEDDWPLLEFFNGTCFTAYPGERGASPSVNIHALSVLRNQPRFPHRTIADQVTEWLIGHMSENELLEDKWNISPFYAMSQIIPAFAGWQDDVARHYIKLILDQQRTDGGWGWFGSSTPEETAYCVIGLSQIRDQGLLADDVPLKRAAVYLSSRSHEQPLSKLWIGKTLYHPEGITQAILHSAEVLLGRYGYLSMQKTA